ncbi:MAG TPA: fibronectin type III domain-containing protein [Thermoanaerobaculia bacterium]|nr:fibronectin type III domain-containing protein [Thermoanaerobaculia bacterium]
MHRVRLLLLLSLTVSAFAADQPLRFGAAFPVSNTSYGTASAVPRLVAAGDELFAFWATLTDVRMTKIGAERRSGVPVFTFAPPGTQLSYRQPWVHPAGATFDVVWTGSHFVLAVDSSRSVVTQKLDTLGRPIDAPVTVVAQAGGPELAYNGRTMLLLYTTLEGYNSRSLILDEDGRVAGPGEAIAGGAGAYALIEDGDAFASLVRLASGTYIKRFDADGRSQPETFVTTDLVSGLAASPDGWLLTASSTVGRTLLAYYAGRSGAVSAPLTLAERTGQEPVGFNGAKPAWDGSAWIVTYTRTTTQPPAPKNEFHVIALDPGATRIVASREPIAGKSAGVTDNIGGRIWVSWYPDQLAPPPAPLFAELPLQPELAEAWTYRAGDQYLMATAASKDATLVVWREEINDELRLRAGVRTKSGEWLERTIGTTTYGKRAVAASDGTNFIVSVTSDYAASEVYRLDARGARMAPELTFESAQISGIAWNGRRWVLVHGGSKGMLEAIFVAPAGTTVETAEIDIDAQRTVHSVVVASDGDGLAVAWAEGSECWILPCHGAYEIHAMRVTAGFEPRDGDGWTLAPAGPDVAMYDGPAVVWSGTEFVVAWFAWEEGVVGAALPRSGGAPSAPFVLSGGGWLDDSLRATPEGIAVVALHDYYSGHVVLHDRARGTVRSRTFDHAQTAVLNGWPRIEVLPDGRLAYLVSRVSPDAPQHGASHVMMAVQDAVSIPGAPLLTATNDHGAVDLVWTAAPGAVTGYRVEYRINDGSWNEIGRWFTAGERATTFRAPVTATTVSFRVRAWSDAGTGPYSDEARPSDPPKPATPRRRSVR